MCAGRASGPRPWSQPGRAQAGAALLQLLGTAVHSCGLRIFNQVSTQFLNKRNRGRVEMIAKKITGNKEHPELVFQRDHTRIQSSQIFFKRLLSGSLAWWRGVEKSHPGGVHR